MRNKIKLFLGIFILLIILLNGCNKKEEKQSQGVNIANPASVNCVNNGGKLKILENDKGQYGVCVLPDGAECEEWAYYRKECPKAQSNVSCREERTDCCKGFGENISCIHVEIDCAVGYESKFLGCDLEKCTPKWDCTADDEKSCNANADCACGVHVKTGECFAGNKKYVDASKQCPDFCTGIAGHLELRCVNNQCALNSKDRV